MTRIWRVWGGRTAACAAGLALLWGPGQVADSPVTFATAPAIPSVPRVVRVTDRPGDPKGRVLVLMYHRFGPKEAYMVRSYANFRKDLHWLRAAGFRPVTMSQFVADQMDLPPGAMPVVLTFDDSPETQFGFRPDGKIDPNSGVGIWSEFAAKYPDFPVRGTFYILPNGPFGPKAQGRKKVAMLLAWGSEIGGHSLTHASFARLTDEGVKREMAGAYDYLRSLGVEPRAFALPYGALPKNRALLRGFEWNGRRYAWESTVLAGAGPALSPRATAKNRQMIERVQAYEGRKGIVWWLNRLGGPEFRPYVQP